MWRGVGFAMSHSAARARRSWRARVRREKAGVRWTAAPPNGRRVFAMEISPAYMDVAVERWQADTGRDAVLEGDGRTFAQVKTERLGESDTKDDAA